MPLLTIDGEVVGGLTDIDMTSSRDIDQVSYGDPKKPFVIPTIKTLTEFTLSPFKIDGTMLESVHLGSDRAFEVQMRQRPAWWNRLKNWLLRREAPFYVYRGRARFTALEYREMDVVLTADIHGPVRIEDPTSKLEKRWAVLCRRIRPREDD